MKGLLGALATALLLGGCGEPHRPTPAPDEPVGAVAQRSEGWDAVRTMAQGRVGHTATLLPDGRVLIAGGRTPDGITDQTELFDPFSGTLAPGPALTQPRELHTATALPDGRVLVAGGSDGQTPLATSEVFDLRTGAFAPGPALTEPRQQQVAVLTVTGELWLLGGQGDSGPLASSERFSGGAFAPGPAMAQARFDHAAVALEQGGLMVFGGHDGAHPLTGVERLADGAQGFEPADEMKQPRAGHTATLRGDEVLVAGGSDGVALLDTIEHHATSGASLPSVDKAQARAKHTATLLPDGALLLSGGAANDERISPSGLPSQQPQQGASEQVAVLLPSGDLLLVGGLAGGKPSAELRLLTLPGQQLQIQPGPLLGSRREGHEAVLLPDGRVLLVGGIESMTLPGTTSLPVLNQYILTMEIVDPVAGTVTAAAALKQPRWRPAALLLPDGRVLISGGGFVQDFSQGAPEPQNVKPLSSTEIYDPATGQVSEGPQMFAARLAHRMTPLPDGRLLISGGSTYWFDELLDLATGMTTPVPAPGTRFGHTAVALPNGQVLLSGASSSLLLYDPAPGSVGNYAPTASIKQTGFTTSDGFLSAVLPDSRVLLLPTPVAGMVGDLNATLLVPLYFFSPDGGPGSLAEGPTIEHRWGATLTLLPTGKALLLGGCSQQECATKESEGAPVWLFSPVEGSVGAGRQIDSLPQQRGRHTATLLPDGRVLLAGGYGFEENQMRAHNSTLLLSLGPPTTQPTPRLAPLPSPVTPGHATLLPGERLLRLSAGSGTRSSSAADFPFALWLSAQGVPLSGRSAAWTTTSLTWDSPASALRGPGWLFPLVAGVVGSAAFAPLAPPASGARCSDERLCPSGHCVDGVCCDSACKGPCMACSALRKGQGDDGACGPVAAGHDPDDDCEAASEQSCGRTGACDGNGACQLFPTSTECADAVCSGGALSLARHCDGKGTCEPASAGDCGYFLCADKAHCASSCDSDADCKPGASCHESQCTVGCVGRPQGADCKGARCGDDGRIFFEVSTCDAHEQCVDRGQDCAPYRCVGSGATAGCAVGCESDAHCQPPAACEQGRCVDQSVARCDGEHAMVALGKVEQECAPLRCEAGGCLVRCRSQADCVEGFACKEDGSCGAPAEQREPERGCALASAAQPTDRPGWLAALGLAGLLGRAIRTRRRPPEAAPDRKPPQARPQRRAAQPPG